MVDPLRAKFAETTAAAVLEIEVRCSGEAEEKAGGVAAGHAGGPGASRMAVGLDAGQGNGVRDAVGLAAEERFPFDEDPGVAASPWQSE
jgi:hypothetical protein